MKKTILLTLTLIISYFGYSQYTIKDLTVKSKTYYGLDQFTNEVHAVIKHGSDTLEIISPKVKYIKLDGKVYEIKRSTELKEVADNYGYFGKLRLTPYIHTDTVTWINPKINQQ